MQSGRGGMGRHKHGVSGHFTVNARYKALMCRDDNRERSSRPRRPVPVMFATVAEALVGTDMNQQLRDVLCHGPAILWRMRAEPPQT